MKHLYILLVFTFFLSCNNNQTNSHSSDRDEISVNKQNSKQPPLPDGWLYGRISEVQANDKIEKNMLSQLNTYNKAVLRGDIENAAKYLYPDATIYFRKYYNGLSDKEIVKDFFKAISDDYQKTRQAYEDQGINMDMFPISINKKIVDGNNLIYLLDVSTTVFNENNSIYTDPETIIGISSNKGTKWTFITLNDDSPNILRLKFSERIIDQVMGY